VVLDRRRLREQHYSRSKPLKDNPSSSHSRTAEAIRGNDSIRNTEVCDGADCGKGLKDESEKCNESTTWGQEHFMSANRWIINERKKEGMMISLPAILEPLYTLQP